MKRYVGAIVIALLAVCQFANAQTAERSVRKMAPKARPAAPTARAKHRKTSYQDDIAFEATPEARPAAATARAKQRKVSYQDDTVDEAAPEMVPTPDSVSDDAAEEYFEPPTDSQGGCQSCGGGCSTGSCCRAACPPWTWGQFDYLLWWGKGSSLPPLVTTSPLGTPQANAGVLGASGTGILFGQQHVDSGVRSGGRLNVGVWLDQQHDVGIGGTFFGMQRVASHFGDNTAGTPIIARPFYNASTNANDSEIISYPGIATGTVSVRTSNDALGAEAYMRECISRNCCARLDFISGYQFLRVDEAVNIYDNTFSTDQSGFVPPGTTIVGSDNFLTRNQFNGGTIGLMSQVQNGRWGWSMLGKIAFGNVHQFASISGNTGITVPGSDPFSTPGSLYALPTNIGGFSRNRFAVVPEVNFNLSYQLSPRWSARFGYTFLYISRIAQASRQIDTTVNPTQIGNGTLVGAPRPQFSFHSTDFWLQGMNFGLEYRF